MALEWRDDGPPDDRASVTRRVLSALVGVVVVLLAVLIGPAPAQAATFFEIKNLNSGLCLAVAGGSTANGAEVIQWTCNGNLEQRWYSAGEWLYNAKSGRCLSVPEASKSQGKGLVQWTCKETYSLEQRWTYPWIESNLYHVVNRNSGLVMAVPGRSEAPGTQVIQWGYNGGTEQNWRFRGLSDTA